MAYIGSGLTRFNTADDLTVTDDAEIGGDLTVTGSADINGGTIDGVTIGGASAGAVTATTITGSGDMNIDSGTLFVDASTNNVGIGTTSPSYKLHIDNVGGGDGIALQDTNDGGSTGLYFLNNSGTTVARLSGLSDNTGMTFETSGSERMRIDSSGRVTKPYQPVFFAFRNSNYTITTSSVEMVYQTAKINIGSHYNTGNGRFTAPISGVYEFAYASIASNTATVTRFALAKNGSMESAIDELRLDQLNTTSQYATNGEFCRYISLSAGDYVSVFVNNDSGTNTGYGSTAYSYTYFRGRLVG